MKLKFLIYVFYYINENWIIYPKVQFNEEITFNSKGIAKKKSLKWSEEFLNSLIYLSICII